VSDFTDWLAGWFSGWLASWLIDWLIGWLVGWLVDCGSQLKTVDFALMIRSVTWQLIILAVLGFSSIKPIDNHHWLDSTLSEPAKIMCQP